MKITVGKKYKCINDFYMDYGRKVLTKNKIYEISFIGMKEKGNKSNIQIIDDDDDHWFTKQFFNSNHKKCLFVDIVGERKLKLNKLKI